ncbi:MAG: hypothetical protein ABIJ26_05775 [Candidatus Margulisiibacteriota bacterium]
MKTLIIKRSIPDRIKITPPGLAEKASVKVVERGLQKRLIGSIEVKDNGLELNADPCRFSGPVAARLRCLGVETIKLDIDAPETFAFPELLGAKSLQDFVHDHPDTTVVDLSTPQGKMDYIDHELARWQDILNIINEDDADPAIVERGFARLAKLREKKRIYISIGDLSEKALAIVWHRVPVAHLPYVIQRIYYAFLECLTTLDDNGTLFIRALRGGHERLGKSLNPNVEAEIEQYLSARDKLIQPTVVL